MLTTLNVLQHHHSPYVLCSQESRSQTLIDRRKLMTCGTCSKYNFLQGEIHLQQVSIFVVYILSTLPNTIVSVQLRKFCKFQISNQNVIGRLRHLHNYIFQYQVHFTTRLHQINSGYLRKIHVRIRQISVIRTPIKVPNYWQIFEVSPTSIRGVSKCTFIYLSL